MRRIYRIILFALLSVLLLFCLRVNGLANQENTFVWKNVNLQGMGYITGVVISPVAPFDVYVKADVSAPYRYDREKEEWIPLFEWCDYSIQTESIAVHPTDPNTAYAVIPALCGVRGNEPIYGGDVAITHDRGETWTFTGLSNMSRQIYINGNAGYRTWTGERLAVDSNQPDTLYFASSRNGLWVYKNKSWSQVPYSSGLPNRENSSGDSNPGYTFVLVDPRGGVTSDGSSKLIYVGVLNDGVYRSVDGGKTFSRINGSTKTPGKGVITQDGTIVVAGQGVVQKITRSLQVQAITPPGGNGSYFQAVAIHPYMSQQILLGQGRKLWRSMDGGNTYVDISIKANDSSNDNLNGQLAGAPGYYAPSIDANGGVAGLCFDPAGQLGWYTNGWGVAKTNNIYASQVQWEFTMKNLEEFCARQVKVPRLPKEEGGADLWCTVADCMGFVVKDRDVPPDKKISAENQKTDPQYFWYPDLTLPVPLDGIGGITGIDICETKPEFGVFVGVHQWMTYQETGEPVTVHGITKDGGETWQAFESVPTERFYVNGSSGTIKEYRAYGGAVAISPTDPNLIIWEPAGTKLGLYYSRDGGKSWAPCKLAKPPSRPNNYNPYNSEHFNYDAPKINWIKWTYWNASNCLAADRADPTGKTFYYSDNNGKFYRTSDGGATWYETEGGENLPMYNVRVKIAPNPYQKGDVWLTYPKNDNTVIENALYRSRDGGKTFQKVTSVKAARYITFGKGKTDDTPALFLLGMVGGDQKPRMYKSEDMGSTWIPISDPNENVFATMSDLEGDMRTENLVYYTMNGRGVGYGYCEPKSEQPPEIDDFEVLHGVRFYHLQENGKEVEMPEILQNGGQAPYQKMEGQYSRAVLPRSSIVKRLELEWANDQSGRPPSLGFLIQGKTVSGEWETVAAVSQEEIQNAVSEAGEKKKVTMIVGIRQFIDCTEIRLVVDGRDSIQNANMGLPQAQLLRLKIYGYLLSERLLFEPKSVTASDGKLKSIHIEKIEPYDMPCVLLVAVCEKSQLKSVFMTDIPADFKAGDISCPFSVSVSESTEYVLYAWDSLSNMKPVGKSGESWVLSMVNK